MNHGTREMLQAVALLKHEHAVPCKVILFALRPDAASFQATDVGRLARELDIEDTIDLRAMIPYKAMFPLMQTCDVGVIAYGQAFGRKCMPNRIFEYMASGIPVVAPAYALELEGLIRQHQCGVLCNTEDSQDLAATLLRLWNEKGLAQRMGANGRAAFEDKLNWECESQPLMDWFRSPASVCPETAEAMTP
jgi:glycosyltransferase involved in cell wall biosynthesis